MPFRCQGCDADLGPDDRFCRRCGAQVSRACPRCGRSLAADSRFCSGCGISVASPMPMPTPTPIPSPTPPPTATQPPSPTPPHTATQPPTPTPAPPPTAPPTPAPGGCPACGTRLRPGLRFCTRCATEVGPPAARRGGRALAPLLLSALLALVLGAGGAAWLLTRKASYRAALGSEVAVEVPAASVLVSDLVKAGGGPPSGRAITNLADLPHPDGTEILGASRLTPDGLEIRGGLVVTWPLASPRPADSKLPIAVFDPSEGEWLDTGMRAVVSASGREARGRVYHFSDAAVLSAAPPRPDPHSAIMRALEPAPLPFEEAVARVRAVPGTRERAQKAVDLARERLELVNDFWGFTKQTLQGSSRTTLQFLYDTILPGVYREDPSGFLRRCEDLRSKSGARLEGKEKILFAWLLRIGACDEHAGTVALMLQEAGVPRVRILYNHDKPGGHTFVGIGMAEGSDDDIPWTWGPEAFVADSWVGRLMTREEAWQHEYCYNWGEFSIGASKPNKDTGIASPSRKRLKILNAAQPAAFLDRPGLCQEYAELYKRYQKIPEEYRTQGLRQIDLPRFRNVGTEKIPFDPKPPRAICPHQPSCFGAPAGLQAGDSARIDPRFDPTSERFENLVFEATTVRLPDDSPVVSMDLRLVPDSCSPEGYRATVRSTLDRLNSGIPSGQSTFVEQDEGGSQRVLVRRIAVEAPGRPESITALFLDLHGRHVITCQVSTQVGGTLDQARAEWQRVRGGALRVLDERYGGE